MDDHTQAYSFSKINKCFTSLENRRVSHERKWKNQSNLKEILRHFLWSGGCVSRLLTDVRRAAPSGLTRFYTGFLPKETPLASATFLSQRRDKKWS